MKAAVTDTQSVRVEQEDQSAVYTEHLRRPDKDHRFVNRLRIRIRLNFYMFQSWGKVERWDGNQWHTVADMTGAAMAVSSPVGNGGSARVRANTATATDFTRDRDRLLALAAEIVD